MNNNWIRHLAADIADRFNRPQAERMLEDVIREAVRENMPDAESLTQKQTSTEIPVAVRIHQERF